MKHRGVEEGGASGAEKGERQTEGESGPRITMKRGRGRDRDIESDRHSERESESALILPRIKTRGCFKKKKKNLHTSKVIQSNPILP